MKLFLAQSWGPLQAQLSYLLRNMLTSPQRRKCADAARIAAGETAISHNSRRPTTASVGIFVALTLAGLAMPRQEAADEVTAPGKWRPHPNPMPANPPIPDPVLAVGNSPALLSQWVQLVPFTMVMPWQFRLPGPPALASVQYAKDYDEVMHLGAKNSTARTNEQSEIARYWYEGSPQGWSRIARVVAAQRGLDRWDNARLLALVNAAIADGSSPGLTPATSTTSGAR